MAFTTQTFLFLFFPLCVVLFYAVTLAQKIESLSAFLKRIRAQDLVLIFLGCGFYMWACFDDVFRLLIYVFVIYILGRLIQYVRKNGTSIVLLSPNEVTAKSYFSVSGIVLFVAVFMVVSVLIHFKYTKMLTQVWNYLFKDTLAGKSVIAPLGISFITFSAISYLTDIHLGKAEAGDLIDCTLYLTFFPKVVSGPIVLWRDFQKQIGNNTIHLTNISNGINRVMIGFAKKLILADTFGACIASIPRETDALTAFGIGLLYMLQIYYDFSGYSDIAIGLSDLLGFSVKENFNFPYLSCSITEFWRRWHISLSTWFREYVYFPLGGSRAGKTRTVINIGIVFLLTGIWHGAGWTYMLWGILNGLCNIIEKLLSGKAFYERIPKFFKWLFTMAVTYFCWGLFRVSEFSAFKDWFMTLTGMLEFNTMPYSWQYYFDLRMLVFIVVAILGATVWGLPKVQTVYHKITKTGVGYLIYEVILLALFIISIMFMINSKYSPFIYFQY